MGDPVTEVGDAVQEPFAGILAEIFKGLALITKAVIQA